MSNTKIPESVKRDLWFAAHGRCEFAGCNKVLFKHGITMDDATYPIMPISLETPPKVLVAMRNNLKNLQKI